MTRQVTLVEINIFEGLVPLVSGYLESYAGTDPEIRKEYGFEKYAVLTNLPATEIVQGLLRRPSALYAFSCYTWNMGLVRKILPLVLEARPEAYILLGGPQVMFHAKEYLDPTCDRMMICNGEGEKTFLNVLSALTEPRPDFTSVRGLSLYRGGALVETEPENRFADLEEIPSPFLAGIYRGQYRASMLETVRGCPYRCGYCFWSSGTNNRLAAFSEERLREEVTWLARHDIKMIGIADANWGMWQRDLELARHIADAKRQYGSPTVAFFASAKNAPERVIEISRTFAEAGLIHLQPISLQSLDRTTLKTIGRANMKLEAFEKLQAGVNAAGIDSFVELIWPLPGETLASFKRGFEQLIERSASVVLIYFHMLLHNTPFHLRREELGIRTRVVRDSVAEAEMVIATAQVSAEDFEAGMWFCYAATSFHNTRSFAALRRHLHETSVIHYADFFSAFADYCRDRPETPYARFCSHSIREGLYSRYNNVASLHYQTLHKFRAEFEELVHGFCSSQPWWDDESVQVLFEIGLVDRFFMYSNTEAGNPLFPLTHLELLGSSSLGHRVKVPIRHQAVLEEAVGSRLKGANPPDARNLRIFDINHVKGQGRAEPSHDADTQADHSYYAVMVSTRLLPEWTGVLPGNPPATVAGAGTRSESPECSRSAE